MRSFHTTHPQLFFSGYPYMTPILSLNVLLISSRAISTVSGSLYNKRLGYAWPCLRPTSFRCTVEFARILFSQTIVQIHYGGGFKSDDMSLLVPKQEQ